MSKKLNKYVIAVSDYENTVKAVVEDGKVMPREAGVYKDFFDNVLLTCNEMSFLRKFIRKTHFHKKECEHYWEGLLSLNYTLAIIEYDTDDENFVENSCDNELIKFISVIR